MVLKFSLNKNTTSIVALSSFSLLSIFIASCGKISASIHPTSTVTNTGNSSSPTGGEINNLVASVAHNSQCSDKTVDFCVYKELTNKQSVQIIFTPDKGFVTDISIDLIGIKDSEWSISSCSDTISTAEPCTATLTYDPKKVTAGVQTLNMNYSYKNNKGEKVSNVPVSFKYQSISLINQSNAFTEPDLSSFAKSVVNGSDLFALTNTNDFKYISNFETLPKVNKTIPNIVKFDAHQFLNSQNVILKGSDANYVRFNTTFDVVKALDFQNAENSLVDVVIGKNAIYGCKSAKDITTISASGDISTFSLPSHIVIDRCIMDSSDTSDVVYVVSHDAGLSSSTKDGYYLSALTTGKGKITGIQAISPLIKTIASDTLLEEKIMFTVKKNNSLFIATNLGHLYGLTEDETAKTINLIPNFNYSASKDNFIFAPLYDDKNSVIYLVTSTDDTNYTLRAIDSSTGIEQWNHPFSNRISAPILTSKSNSVLIASTDGNVYSFNSTSSSPVKTFPLNTQVNAPASALDNLNNVFYIPTFNNNSSCIYSFHTDW